MTEEIDRFLSANGRKYTAMERGRLSAETFKEYSFVQMADPQFGMMSQIQDVQHLLKYRTLIKYLSLGFADYRKIIPIPILDQIHHGKTREELFEKELELSRITVKCINAMTPKPVFAVVCGDLVHSYPDSDPENNRVQVEAFKQVFSEIDPSIKLVCLCGNHDVGDAPTEKTIQTWKDRFGDDYFSFWVGDDKFIVLNSQMYKNSTKCGVLAKNQDIWLDRELEECENRRHTTVFSHIPPFIKDPQEASAYFPLEKNVRLDLLKRMISGNVSHWFCGHYHRNSEGTYLQDGKELKVITTGAIGANITTDPEGDALDLSGMGNLIADIKFSGLRIVHVSEHGIEQRYCTLESLMSELNL